MKYALYGLPCTGKTTLLNELKIPVIHGSIELNKLAYGNFSGISEDEKVKLRIKYAEQLQMMTDSFISDGHYSFLKDVVFTKADGDVYDVFIYLYCEPKVISERLKVSVKNSKFAHLSVENIRKWQNFEMESLRAETHKRNKDFYVLHDVSSFELQSFIDEVENGFSPFAMAMNIVEKMRQTYPEPCELHICDGDKTIIEQDSFRVCMDDYITHAFDGNFYTGYQALRFTEEVSKLQYDTNQLSMIRLNRTVYDMLKDKNYVILSSGVKSLWESLAERFNLGSFIADTLISADTKYFVVKLLQSAGYKVTSYGDSKNDYYMLKQSDNGYLYIGSYLSRSLKDTNLSGVRLLYDKSPYILADVCNTVSNDIEICKSNSGINGSKLADAHIRLGKLLGETIRSFIPSANTAVIVLERGGRFFGDGIYTSFGGTFYSYDTKQDVFPNVKQSVAVIVDSVINTGKSVLETIEKLKLLNSDIEVFIVTNVIQERALKLLKDYKVFAIRTSSNCYIGCRQVQQKDGKGPDTADRLFNYMPI